MNRTPIGPRPNEVRCPMCGTTEGLSIMVSEMTRHPIINPAAGEARVLLGPGKAVAKVNGAVICPCGNRFPFPAGIDWGWADPSSSAPGDVEGQAGA